ncbi:MULTISPECIES: glycerol kinase GlpK [unclassified Novosphingobium]|uniref:glycerol kinase GlpK n=1 Tax=unclassified Novosphingobium TaxID=2644732 RepID=UPI000869853C|nr:MULTISPECIES: glycerol kinase GlpK [unclassified Novosphingobium]MDR6708616.1 glycerol kinase [Novosphingobium sp. 1748]ODU82024.1 MAG: glycerol kinase [Novosphingobium sp. SCN 63-17]OJX96747.1 MAG: glycerol kinase [Novosphingobium sp. 63-713]
MSGHILSIDQGTTSTRSLIFAPSHQVIASAQQEFAQHYPADGWVEHDAEDIWRDTLATAQGAMAKAGMGPDDIAAIGITNQRETVVLWDRATGAPLHRAIVWQDRRTAEICARLHEAGHEALVQERTGLLLDPYFSATKLAWLLDTIPGARERAEKGELAFGTIDTFLLWRLTEGREHKTDVTNASRTLLFDIRKQRWCPDLLALFRIPAAVLPQVCQSADDFGVTHLLGGTIPIRGIAGDQQAALVGQSCLAPGQAKITYGTGGFMLMNTGEVLTRSRSRLLTTIAYRIDGVTHYAMEGSLFVAGAAIKWLRDGLGIIVEARQTQEMAARLPDNGGVYMVPAFVGLGAPHWCTEARGMLTGMTFDSGAAHIARAALESVAFQTADLVAAMQADGAGALAALRVDGGMAANDWFCQFLADILDIVVERPANLETTALGAAMLAGHASGVWPDALSGASRGEVVRFHSQMEAPARQKLQAGWQAAIRRATAR